MPIEFVARVAGVDDEYSLVAAVAEHEDGTGRALMFQAALEDPDEQDVLLRMDTHCLVTEDQGTAYGCVRELTIDGDRMHLVLAPEALAALGLDDAVLDVRLAVDARAVEVLRECLGRILTYGRPGARPAVLRL